MQLPPLLRPAVALGIACYPRSRAGPSARRGCAARRAAAQLLATTRRLCIESLCTPSQHIKEGNLAAHVAMPSVPSPNEIVVAQQTVKNEENARSHTRSIPCLKAISRRPNCCILRPVCHQHRGAEDLATIAPQGASSASPPLTGFPGSERLPCAYYVSSRRSFVQEKGVIPIKISH